MKEVSADAPRHDPAARTPSATTGRPFHYGDNILKVHPLAPPATFRLWWLPLIAGLLPLAAAVVAFNLAVAQGQFAACNPLLDGCVSISRAARHDLPNILFRALLLPAATLQAIVWLQTGPWLQELGALRDRLLTALPWIGVTAAVFLVLYGAFLGTDGTGYRLMRRYGVVVYFGFTCIAMLIVGGALRQASTGGHRRRAGTALYALVAALPVLGIVNSTAPLYLPNERAQDVLGNATEWWGGAVFTAFFVLLAWLWRQSRFSAVLSLQSAPAETGRRAATADAWAAPRIPPNRSRV